MTVNIKAVLVCFCLLSPALALDEFLPIGTRVMQVDLGMSYAKINGDFGTDWKNNDVDTGHGLFTAPMQGKFGLMEGLEGSLGVDYIFQDRNGHAGLDRPVLALKYADSSLGVGGFLAGTLPIGFEDILNAGNFATFTIGALYGHRWGDFNLLANASYNYSTEDKNKSKSDYLDAYLKPGYSLPFGFLTSRKQDLQITLGMRYTYGFNQSVGAKSTDQTANLSSLHPGLFYSLNRIFGAELQGHFTLTGQSQPASTGAELKLHVTLDENLYNAVSN